jgi:hypothetical protein
MGADHGIVDTLTIFMGRFSLVSRSHLDLAHLDLAHFDLNCVRGQSAHVPNFVMALSRRDP